MHGVVATTHLPPTASSPDEDQVSDFDCHSESSWDDYLVQAQESPLSSPKGAPSLTLGSRIVTTHPLCAPLLFYLQFQQHQKRLYDSTTATTERTQRSRRPQAFVSASSAAARLSISML